MFKSHSETDQEWNFVKLTLRLGKREALFISHYRSWGTQKSGLTADIDEDKTCSALA